MKTVKTSSLYRLLAFLLITVLLVCMVCLVVDGWNANEGTLDPDTPSDTATDVPKKDQTVSAIPEPQLPTYFNYLTGLTTTKELSEATPLAALMTPSASMHGISKSILTIEFQIENNDSRLLTYLSPDASLGKLGSIAKNRLFMQALTKTFGGISLFSGWDDTVSYTGFDPMTPSIDLSKTADYAYTENTTSTFTNSDLISAAIDNAAIPTKLASIPTLPFRFTDLEKEEVKGLSSAKSVYIPFGLGSETTLVYSEGSGLYTYQKNGIAVTDRINGMGVSYKNVFVLFANATTYETADATETVLDTAGSGCGYYLTNGTVTKILWHTAEDNTLRITNTAGEVLTVNRGASYITFFKASQKNKVSIY